MRILGMGMGMDMGMDIMGHGMGKYMASLAHEHEHGRMEMRYKENADEMDGIATAACRFAYSTAEPCKRRLFANSIFYHVTAHVVAAPCRSAVASTP